MRRFLTSLPAEKIVLISPVKFQRGTWVPSDDLVKESEKLQDVYKKLAGEMGISFVSTASWPIPLCFDGVHFTERGHRIFVEKLIGTIRKQL